MNGINRYAPFKSFKTKLRFKIQQIAGDSRRYLHWFSKQGSDSRSGKTGITLRLSKPMSTCVAPIGITGSRTEPGVVACISREAGIRSAGTLHAVMIRGYFIAIARAFTPESNQMDKERPRSSAVLEPHARKLP
jgi:hypothetical protein